MIWFTETPWPPMVILSVLGIASARWWFQRPRWQPLIATLICGAAVIGTYVAERRIISDRERIEASLFDMADAFVRRDEPAILGRISPRQDDLKALVTWGFATVSAVDNLTITDVSIDLLMEGSRAVAHFRANGRFHVAGYGDVGHKPTRWELTWQREGADWKIIRIRRLNPHTGEEMNQRAAHE